VKEASFGEVLPLEGEVVGLGPALADFVAARDLGVGGGGGKDKDKDKDKKDCKDGRNGTDGDTDESTDGQGRFHG
jgi:hypothetical protein